MTQTRYLFPSSVIHNQVRVAFSDMTFLSNGTNIFDSDELYISYDRKGDASDVYIATIKLSEQSICTGTAIRLNLTQWEHIDYVAYGFMIGQDFKHIKINHIRQNTETIIEFSIHGLAYRIQNKFVTPSPVVPEAVRLFIKGIPQNGVGIVHIQECYAFNEGTSYNFMLSQNDRKYYFSEFHEIWAQNSLLLPSLSLRSALLEYDKRVFPDFVNSANFYIQGNGFSLAKYANIDLELTSSIQDAIRDNNTLRYSYHGLNHINALLMVYETESDDTYLFAARELFALWEEANFFSTEPEDNRYTWYDHGTAERLLVMMRFWAIGVEKRFDVRFMGRLLYMIKLHADLLANESFYARNQNYRYHNHGIFQDIALLAVSIGFSFIDSASVWQQIALDRMRDQFDHLVIYEKDVAILKENSPGYHDGTFRIVMFINELLKCSCNHKASEYYTGLAEKMMLFSKLMHYPGGRQPTAGDTFRIENSFHSRERALASICNKGFYPFEEAGYLISKGEEQGTFWQMTMVGSSLTKTHKHEDNLSLTIFFDGIEWLSDPSFFSHQYTDIFPAYFRSAKAHNAVAIESLDYSIETGLTHFESTFEDDIFAIDGSHSAYNGIVIKRSVRGSLSSLDLSVVDQVISDEDHLGNLSPMLYWHLGETIDAEITKEGVILSSSLSNYCMLLDCDTNADLTIISGDDNNAPEGWIGTGFCMALPSKIIKCSIPVKQSFKWNISLKENS